VRNPRNRIAFAVFSKRVLTDEMLFEIFSIVGLVEPLDGDLKALLWLLTDDSIIISIISSIIASSSVSAAAAFGKGRLRQCQDETNLPMFGRFVQVVGLPVVNGLYGCQDVGGYCDDIAKIDVPLVAFGPMDVQAGKISGQGRILIVAMTVDLLTGWKNLGG
jgi:hypothetical protein